ncbi:hypothetical protein ACI797_23215 [Geodermatophilus sp. SYSU D00691]
MDVSTAAAGPSLALGIAVAVGVLALAVAVALAVTWRRPDGSAGRGDRPPPPGVFPDDDLPAFREHPPGFPGPRPPGATDQRRTAVGPATPGTNPVRALAVLALVALLLIAAAAAVAATTGDRTRDPGPRSAGTSGAAATSAPVTPSGPGELAALSVPLGADGTAARLVFGTVVLARHEVGITVSTPALSVTVAGDGTALAHVLLPTWNCMTDRPPADPAVAGCRASVVEQADLPTPALAVVRSGDELQLSGRFPTYTEPSGGPPVFTGRVYALDVVVRPDDADAEGWTAASGELSTGGGRVPSVDDATLSAVLAR